MRIPILMYHMVDDRKAGQEPRYCCSTKFFHRQIRYLRRAGYSFIGLHDACLALRTGALAAGRCVSITFDDGYLDNFENALPILDEFSVPATVFVVSGRVGGVDGWRETGGNGSWPLASWEQLREMAEQGVEIGSHTVSHPSLTALDDEQRRREVADSKSALEERLGQPVRFFAYPYGRLDEATRNAVRAAGYEAACSTRSGFNSAGCDPYLLRRLEVYGTDSLSRFALKVAWGTNDASLRTIGQYYGSRVAVRLRRWLNLST
jgi:peptidoglycan/xylan/chitin deacetylase (PgdA/CDA1 family)